MCRRTDDLRKSLPGRAVARHCHLLDGLLRGLADDLLAGVDVAASLLLAEGSVGLVVGVGALGGWSPVRPRKDSTPRGWSRLRTRVLPLAVAPVCMIM